MDISIRKVNTKELKEIQSVWCDAELKFHNNNFFLSWNWIGSWLNGLGDVEVDLYFIEAKDKQLLGLGFLVLQNEKGLTRAYVNKTGKHELDQIWIEFNDFLLESKRADLIRQKMIDFILSNKDIKVDSLQLDMTFQHLSLLQHENADSTLESKGYSKSLEYNDSEAELLQSFSKNTRNQIKRSIKLLENTGSLTLSPLTQGVEKYQMLESIAELHKQQWQGTEWGSGFSNIHFKKFHQQLVEKDNVRILELTLDDKPLAYGYYFCFNKQALFYLSAIEKDDDNRVKIGLVFHLKAMSYFASQGFEKYDFLAGDARYKASLSDEEYMLKSIRIYGSGVKAQTEKLLRQLKNKISNSRT